MTWWLAWILLLCLPSRSSARSGDRRAAAASALRALIIANVRGAHRRCGRAVQPRTHRGGGTARPANISPAHLRAAVTPPTPATCDADEAVSLTTGQHPTHPKGIPSAVALSSFVSVIATVERVCRTESLVQLPQCLRRLLPAATGLTPLDTSSPRPAMLERSHSVRSLGTMESQDRAASCEPH